ncbi:MAG: hypothetical protein KKH94_06750 [Candidatus Omnitrophica bacterium]|nr:hypothetical protein [Candidatus Omnitrophota bacterium]
MKVYLSRAVKTINANILLVILYSCFYLYLTHNKFTINVKSFLLFLIILVGILIFVIFFAIFAPGTYAYFSNIVKYGNSQLSFFKNAIKHLLNFYVVALLIGITYFAIYVIASLIGLRNINTLLPSLMLIPALYILPIVFIRETNIEAISTGLKFFFRNIQPSVPLIAVAVLQIGITQIGALVVSATTQHLFLSIALKSLFSFANTYIQFILFVAASMYFLEIAKAPQKN